MTLISLGNFLNLGQLIMYASSSGHIWNDVNLLSRNSQGVVNTLLKKHSCLTDIIIMLSS